MKIALVCNGSYTRALIGAAIAKEMFGDAEILAAGSIEGETPDEMTLKVLEEDGLNLEGVTQTSLFDLDFDLPYALIVGCDEGGCPLVFADNITEWDFIKNPKGEGIEVYREAKNQLKEELKKFYMENFKN